ncbi:MAG: hypothetical protein ABW007_19105 [Chitinophagaceae bacterium]
MALLTERHLKVFESASPRQIELAVQLLVNEDPLFDIVAFKSFINDFKEAKGNLSAVLGRTHKPVGIEEFITSPSFLNQKIVYDANPDTPGEKTGVYAEVLRHAIQIIEEDPREVLFMGAIGTAKTSLAQILTLYDLYLLSTYKHPQAFLGVLPGSPVLFACMNRTAGLAESVTYKKLRNIASRSPYFTSTWAYNQRRESAMVFPNNIRIQPFAADSEQVLGEDIIGAIVDELNFMSYVEKSKQTKDESGIYDQAKEVYRKLIRRRASRFIGLKAGRICLVSSKSHADDFTEIREKEIEQIRAEGKSTHKAYIYKNAHWEIRPDSVVAAEPRFSVVVGDMRTQTRILGRNERAPSDMQIIQVPESYRDLFVNDPEGSLRDFAGVSSRGTNSYYKNAEDVWRMVKGWAELEMVSPFMQNTINFEQGSPDVNPDYQVPFPEYPRALHIDLSESKCSTGISCGFTLGTVPIKTTVEKADGTLSVITEDMPFVVYDFHLEVIPPKVGQIEIAVIRQWVYMLRDELGLPIDIVTTDQFQSTDTRQILFNRGFRVDKVSVEDLELHKDFRSALSQGRVAGPEHHKAFDELLKLIPDYKKRKIDHPANGSKDVSDAMLGVFTVLSRRRATWVKTNKETGRPEPVKRVSRSAGRPKRGMVKMENQRGLEIGLQ